MREINNPVVDKSFNFSVRIVNCYKNLIKKDKFLSSLYNQLLKSGRSTGANFAELQAGQVKQTFETN